jgi:hypothetical protein
VLNVHDRRSMRLEVPEQPHGATDPAARADLKRLASNPGGL